MNVKRQSKQRSGARTKVSQSKQSNNNNKNRITVANEGTYIKDSTHVSLKYVKNDLQLNNPASYSSHEFKGNSAYDPDPSLFSGGLLGYDEYAALYYKYRVISCHINATFQLLDGITTIAYITASPVSLGNDINNASANQLLENGWTKSCELTPSSVGGSSTQHTLQMTYHGKKVFGAREYFYDRDYASDVTTNPINTFYIEIGIFDALGTNAFSNGAVVKLTITYDIDFFTRRPFPLMSLLFKKTFTQEELMALEALIKKHTIRRVNSLPSLK
jgi:hypothetical protein